MKKLTLLALLSAAGCTTNGAPFEPETILFDYQIRDVAGPTLDQWKASLPGDGRSVGDLLRPNIETCTFRANFGDGFAHPELDIMGVPGEEGANLKIVATNPSDVERGDQGANADEDSPCQGAIEYFQILLGPPINPGEEISVTSAEFTIDGVSYATGSGGYIEGTLNGVTSRGYASGDFGIIAPTTEGDDAKVLVIGDGAYAIRD